MIKSITLYQFRNFISKNLLFDHKRVIIEGENGIGKSNLIEALYYLCLGSSFRERKSERLIHFEKEAFSLRGEYLFNGFNDKIVCQFKDQKKSIFINRYPVADRKELLERYPAIIFQYDDIELSSGEPLLRRQFFDQLAALIYADGYILTQRAYHNLLKQRNSALKQSSSHYLEATKDSFIDLSLEIMRLRNSLILLFNEEFQILTKRYVQRDLYFQYESSIKGDDRESVQRYLEDKESYERLKKSTLFGPHRDRYSLYQENREIGGYLSNGERRMVSLIMKAIAAKFVIKAKNILPIIFLDDVFLELDTRHIEAFWQFLPEYQQLFMTKLPQNKIIGLQEYQLYRLIPEEVSQE